MRALVWPSVAPPFRLWFLLICWLTSLSLVFQSHMQCTSKDLHRSFAGICAFCQEAGACADALAHALSWPATRTSRLLASLLLIPPLRAPPSAPPRRSPRAFPRSVPPRPRARTAAATRLVSSPRVSSRLASTRLVSPPRVSSRLVSRSGWAGTWHATAEMGDAILFDLRTHHRGGQNKASTVRQHGRGPTAACVCIVMLLINSTGTARRTSTSTSTTQAQAASHRSYE